MTRIDEDAAANDFEITVKMLRGHGVDITLIDPVPDGTFVLTTEDGRKRVAFGPADGGDGWDWTGKERTSSAWGPIVQDWAPSDEAMAAVLKD